MLRQRGHTLVVVHRSKTATTAIPPWSDVRGDVEVVCKPHDRFADVLDVESLDVMVVGIFHQVAEVLAGVSCPVVYYEQGHEWLFADDVRFQVGQGG